MSTSCEIRNPMQGISNVLVDTYRTRSVTIKWPETYFDVSPHSSRPQTLIKGDEEKSGVTTSTVVTITSHFSDRSDEKKRDTLCAPLSLEIYEASNKSICSFAFRSRTWVLLLNQMRVLVIWENATRQFKTSYKDFTLVHLFSGLQVARPESNYVSVQDAALCSLLSL